LPDVTEPRLNLLHLREGRLPERERTDEVAINEVFAKARRMHVGATFKALLNGKKRKLKVVGIALSPEFIYALGPGDLMPEDGGSRSCGCRRRRLPPFSTSMAPSTALP
jgi:putative ABC transport system permease protein